MVGDVGVFALGFEVARLRGYEVSRNLETPKPRNPVTYGSGATLFFVDCSNAYASRSNVGSLHAIPLKLTPNGCGFALNPSGNAGVGAFGTSAYGTMTVG